MTHEVPIEIDPTSVGASFARDRFHFLVALTPLCKQLAYDSVSAEVEPSEEVIYWLRDGLYNFIRGYCVRHRQQRFS